MTLPDKELYISLKTSLSRLNSAYVRGQRCGDRECLVHFCQFGYFGMYVRCFMSNSHSYIRVLSL